MVSMKIICGVLLPYGRQVDQASAAHGWMGWVLTKCEGYQRRQKSAGQKIKPRQRKIRGCRGLLNVNLTKAGKADQRRQGRPCLGGSRVDGMGAYEM